MSIYRIDLDVQALNSQVWIAMHTGDEGHDIRVRLNASGVPYALEDGCFGILSIKDGDVPVVWDYMAVNGDELRYTTKAGLTNKAAQLVAEVKIFVEGECKLTTPSFHVYVDQTVVNTDDVVMNNQPSASAFEQLIYEGQSIVGDAKAHAEEAAASASDATTAQVAAETARDVAVQKATEAYDASYQAQGYVVSASGHASEAGEQARKAANSATAAAASATASAGKATEAQSQAEKAAASASAAAGSAGAAKESAERVEALFGGAANALKKTVSGEEIAVSDVSPLEHGLKVRLLGENLLPWPPTKGSLKPNEDGSILVTKESTAHTVTVIATFEGDLALPYGEYTLVCKDGWDTYNGARVLVYKNGTSTRYYAYGNTVKTFTVSADVDKVEIYISCNRQGTTTLSPMLVKGNVVPDSYIMPTKWENVTAYCAASRDAEGSQSATPDTYGFVSDLKSVSPSMALWCDGEFQGLRTLDEETFQEKRKLWFFTSKDIPVEFFESLGYMDDGTSENLCILTQFDTNYKWFLRAVNLETVSSGGITGYALALFLDANLAYLLYSTTAFEFSYDWAKAETAGWQIKPDFEFFVGSVSELSYNFSKINGSFVQIYATIPTDTVNVVATYNRDINVAYEELVNAVIALGGVLG